MGADRHLKAVNLQSPYHEAFSRQAGAKKSGMDSGRIQQLPCRRSNSSSDQRNSKPYL
jgi:hypothetical protein